MTKSGNASTLRFLRYPPLPPAEGNNIGRARSEGVYRYIYPPKISLPKIIYVVVFLLFFFQDRFNIVPLCTSAVNCLVNKLLLQPQFVRRERRTHSGCLSQRYDGVLTWPSRPRRLIMMTRLHASTYTFTSHSAV